LLTKVDIDVLVFSYNQSFPCFFIPFLFLHNDLYQLPAVQSTTQLCGGNQGGAAQEKRPLRGSAG
ncbi:hypothetical protein M1N63_02940, partial [Thermodesulfovibrionales bacterium]|nr:hypothetical protein [Thermodesulfovibrionales bacterium]